MSNYLNNTFKFIDASIILDFSSCKYLGEIHKLLKDKFGLPDYYGENWDALYDCLDGRFCEKKEYFVKIIGYNALPDELRDNCKTMLEIFNEIETKNTNVKFNIIS